VCSIFKGKPSGTEKGFDSPPKNTAWRNDKKGVSSGCFYPENREGEIVRGKHGREQVGWGGENSRKGGKGEVKKNYFRANTSLRRGGD